MLAVPWLSRAPQQCNLSARGHHGPQQTSSGTVRNECLLLLDWWGGGNTNDIQGFGFSTSAIWVSFRLAHVYPENLPRFKKKGLKMVRTLAQFPGIPSMGMAHVGITARVISRNHDSSCAPAPCIFAPFFRQPFRGRKRREAASKP